MWRSEMICLFWVISYVNKDTIDPNAWNVISLTKSVSTANWIFLLALNGLGYAIVFPLLTFCGSECHSLFMHCMKSYFLLSGLNLLSFSCIHCPLSSAFGNVENKSSQHVSSGVFIIFLVISLLPNVLLEMNNPFLFSSPQRTFFSSFP